MSSTSFLNLTPNAVMAAAEAVGLRPTGHCTPLTCLENRVYDLRLEDNSNVVLKFYRPGRWSLPEILEEHEFLADLNDSEIPVCSPLQLKSGKTVGIRDTLHFAVWPRTGGRAPDELRDPEIAILGRLLARLHNVGATRALKARPRLDEVTRLHEPLSFLRDNDFIPPSCENRYLNAALAVADRYEELSKEVPMHRIHGDCHFGNLLRGSSGWFFLDFDDCTEGPAVQDIWMLLPGRDSEGERQRLLLVNSYREFRDFEDRWLALVEPLRGMRYVWYAAWIAKRISDPAFPSAFPHFGDEEYWLRETQDLEAQLEVTYKVSEDKARSRSGTPEEETLANKDFFWDM